MVLIFTLLIPVFFPHFTYIVPGPSSICLTEEGDGIKGARFCQKLKSAHKPSFPDGWLRESVESELWLFHVITLFGLAGNC